MRLDLTIPNSFILSGGGQPGRPARNVLTPGPGARELPGKLTTTMKGATSFVTSSRGWAGGATRWSAIPRGCGAMSAPKHVVADIRDDFHRIVYAASGEAARTAVAAFERTWAKRCPGVVTSLREGGDELLTFFRFPKTQWKTLRTTNVIERIHEEFRRRVKTQGSLPTEDAALILLFSRVASGQIKLRRIDGWRKIAGMISQHTGVAA